MGMCPSAGGFLKRFSLRVARGGPFAFTDPYRRSGGRIGLIDQGCSGGRVYASPANRSNACCAILCVGCSASARR